MELQFINNTAEFHADKHFNIHLEGVTKVELYHRTSGTEWDYVADIDYDYSDVIDVDVAVNIPKDFKIITNEMPTMAVVTLTE